MRAAKLLIAILAFFSSPAFAGSRTPDYLGTWVITGSTPAPWIKSDAELFELERSNLLGRTILFTRKNVVAPAPMGCKDPQYHISRYPAEALFQGGLTDPTPQAAALGFDGNSIPTLVTECEGFLDYHFINRDTAMFALNNALYRMKRKP